MPPWAYIVSGVDVGKLLYRGGGGGGGGLKEKRFSSSWLNLTGVKQATWAPFFYWMTISICIYELGFSCPPKSLYTSCSSRFTTYVSCFNAFFSLKNAVNLASSLPLDARRFSSAIKLCLSLRSYACNANQAQKHLLLHEVRYHDVITWKWRILAEVILV